MFRSNGGQSPANIERAHKVGSRCGTLAPAKLNLYLEVLGPRADGFHPLETLMVPVRIYDQLFWQEGSPAASQECLTLRVRSLLPEVSDTDQLLGDGSDNLVLRAARLLAKNAGIAPRGRFDLFKRIPVQAGMGGGSSDAAAALLLANVAWRIGYSRRQLLPLAAQLGSDVPFFLSQGAALCRGRGELIEPVTRLPRLHFVIVKPTAGLSTAEVFGRLPQRAETGEARAKTSDERVSQLIGRLQSGDIAAACQAMTNRLEIAATQLAPWLGRLRAILMRLGCLGYFMTGSGSAYVGVMHSANQARYIARRLVNMNYRTGLNLESVFATSN